MPSPDAITSPQVHPHRPAGDPINLALIVCNLVKKQQLLLRAQRITAMPFFVMFCEISGRAPR
jgi:hypothetical protein